VARESAAFSVLLEDRDAFRSAVPCIAGFQTYLEGVTPFPKI
jgi:hypothetical protein